jgi:hypothetical protein
MTQTKTSGPITPIDKNEEIGNTDTIITDFWEYQEKPLEKTMIAPIQEILELIRSATTNVFIYTPMITDGELIREIEYSPESKAFYALTMSVDKHDKIKNIIIREKTDIASTMVLVDVKTKNTRGLWFPGALTINPPCILHLTGDQVREAHAHFSHYFWAATGEELFHGKTRQLKQYNPKPPEVNPVLKETIRIRPDGVEPLIHSDIDEMWIPSNADETITKYHPASKTLRVEITDDLKDRVYLDTIDSEVYGCKAHPPTYIKTDGRSYIMDNDIGFKLTSTQEKELLAAFNSWPLQYFKKKTIGEIKTSSILTGPWGKSEPAPILDIEPVPEENAIADNIDEWLLGEKKPVFKNRIVLANMVRHEWKIEPPYLKKDAKKHYLYRNWDDFSDRLKKEANAQIKILSENIENAGNGLDKLLALKDKGRWESWKKELEETLSKEWSSNHDRNDLVKAIERLYEIKRSLEQEKQNARMKGESEEASVLNELKKDKISKRKLKKMEKARKKQAQNAPKKFEEDGQASPLVEVMLDTNGLNDMKNRIPPAPLPSLGTLYEHNSRNYLCIKNVEEIESAKKILDNYKPPAVIAVERKT